MNPVPTKERRDYTPYFAERDRQEREDNITYLILVMALVILIMGLTLMMYDFTPTVHAEDTIGRQMLTKKEVCHWSKLSGQKIIGGINPCV